MDAARCATESKMAFKMMENIGQFLDACYAFGVLKVDLFQTVDLYEAQNLVQVIDTIHALGRKTQSRPGYDGPILGPKEVDEQRREFTEEQLAGQNVIGLQMGDASQARMNPYGFQRQIY